MTIVQTYKVIQSRWPNEDGNVAYVITDGVQEKGNFATRKEAEDNMIRIILAWRQDS